MTKDQIGELKKLISVNGIWDYKISKKILAGKPLPNYFKWAKGKKHDGAFLITNKYKESYWFVLIEWKPKNNYLVLFPEKKGTPLVEIHKLDSDDENNEFLIWSYKPTKGDGRNLDRVKYFEKVYFDSPVKISFPVIKSEMPDFYDEIFSLIDARVKSDLLDYIEEPEFRNSFPEGKRIERLHKSRERNPILIKIAKTRFKQEHGKLFCEVCKFNFEEKYGDIGQDFIEAHHTAPLSQNLDETILTKIEDIAMLCSNCHTMIHRKRPWLSINEIKKLLTRK